MNKKAEESARNDGGTVEVETGTTDAIQPIISGAAALPQEAKH
jgi:hypothetical protein